MKVFLVIILALSSFSLFAQQNLRMQEGVYRTNSRICGHELTRMTSGLITSTVNNYTYPGSNCSEAGSVNKYQFGQVQLADGREFFGYFQLCKGSSTNWCKAIEVVNTSTYIWHENQNLSHVFYLH